ncbi:hypothetical protein [Noviherbaspirillum aerium]|uniref:hypothetical protein n=1 Tax=Noviherbaspirillum aerium TaxID=2588497 RepID=UPI00124F687E|nr:hypothetical protein [Noviherbaspirillum aerium]
MAMDWLKVLKHVPWSEVIGNAPGVAENARKLWGAVAKPPAAPVHTESDVHIASPQEVIADIDARLNGAEAGISDLHAQMRTSSELIKALAEQNAQLIQRIEANRKRLVTLAVATGVSGAVAVIALITAIVRTAA